MQTPTHSKLVVFPAPHFTEITKSDYILSIRTLFIIPLVLMSLVSFPSAVYAENIGLMQSLIELSSYTKWHPFFKTSFSILIWTFFFMSVIWIGYWCYLKRGTIKTVGEIVGFFESTIDFLLVIVGLLLFRYLLLPLLALIPAVIVGYFFNESVGVLAGIITLVFYTLPVRKIKIIDRFLPKFFSNDDDDKEEGVGEKESATLPKYFQNIDPQISDKDPVNFKIQDDDWYKKIFISNVENLNISQKKTLGIHINSIKSQFYYGDSDFIHENKRIYFKIETLGIAGSMVINQEEREQAHFGKGTISPKTIHYRPNRDDPLTDEQLALRNPDLHQLKERGFSDWNYIPVKEISAEPSEFLFVEPDVRINIGLLRDDFQEFRKQLSTHNNLPKISYSLSLTEDWEEDPEIAWQNRQTRFINFCIKNLAIEHSQT